MSVILHSVSAFQRFKLFFLKLYLRQTHFRRKYADLDNLFGHVTREDTSHSLESVSRIEA